MDTVPSHADDHHDLIDVFMCDVLWNLKLIDQCFDSVEIKQVFLPINNDMFF